jgi:hypothetical protein
MSTKLLLNNKEIANFLNSKINIVEHLKKFEMNMTQTAETISWVRTGVNKKGLHNLDIDAKKKYKDKIIKSVNKDLRVWFELMKVNVTYYKENNWNTIHKKIDHILEKLGEERVIEEYKKSSSFGFVKGCGLNIDPNGLLIRRHRFNSYDEDCLIRNTVGNEELLVTKIDRSLPFWFIDSGYTNFLEPNKKWHRLVRNHLHYGRYFDAPTDRLNIFKSFPRPWRDDGDIIYVIEPGPFAADIFHVDLKTWKYDIEKELRNYTDKKIKFREKAPKRERTNLYQELADDDYYCVISINSNAATEAIWQGIPAITLDRHITNPITVNKISDINDLYRGRIADWLCMLSYSQFTYNEITNGTALTILKKYHE